MSILNNSLLLGADAGAAGYQISRSLRFNSSDSAFCGRSFSSAGNRRTWTFAAWIKRSSGSTEQAIFSGGTGSNDSTFGQIIFANNDSIRVNGYTSTWRETSQVFRDYSAWYHIVVAFDTTQATASNRVKLYVNGAEVAQFAQSFNPSLNTDYGINQADTHQLGKTTVGSGYFNGYLADVHFIDGQALTPSSFTEVSATTGQLVPKQYTGSFGTNGFWLKFSDNSAATATTLGKDYSGNSNNWSPTNLSVTAGAGNDSLTDTPTSYGTDTGAGGEVRGNYATLNPLAESGGNRIDVTNGNLDADGNSFGNWGTLLSSIAVSSGKWYAEFTVATAGLAVAVGILDVNPLPSAYSNDDQLMGRFAKGYGYRSDTGNKMNNNSATAYGATYTNGDVIGVALDLDAGTIVFYKNNTSQGTAYSSLSGSFAFAVSVADAVSLVHCNFGQRQWAYAAPAGFKALVDTNLPAPVVAKSSDYFQTVLYTGNGSTQTVSGLGFSPDFVWIKQRNGTVGHLLYDQIRGGSMYLQSNTTGAEGNQGANKGLYAFTSDGFSVGDQTDGAYGVNGNNISQVAWAFDAGSSTVTNTQGSITSQVRANASAGFSIVTMTLSGGNTIGHGLGIAPSLIILKKRSGASGWPVYHSSLGGTKALELNSTSAVATNNGYWNDANPTSTVFTTGSFHIGDYVAYCFAPVAGYSSFGSYTGNGSSDGPFVFCGFRPRWLLIKNANNASANWFVFDSQRNTYNSVTFNLKPNLSDAEENDASGTVDFLSNGFKIKSSGTFPNGNGNTIIYAAFAESPFQYARAR